MRVLLTHPSSNYSLRTVLGLKSPPLGLAYLATVAERGGHDVRIIDTPTLGLSNAELVRQIGDWQPDVLGVSSTAIGYNDALQVVVEAKKKFPGLRTVMGGPHVSFTDEDALQRCGELDAVVRGEGEQTFQHLLESIEAQSDLSQVEGLTYRGNGDIRRNQDRAPIQDLDSIGFPAFHLLPVERYSFSKAGRFASVVSSRGCPYRCSFCSSSNLFGKKWRFRSPEHVVAEIEYLKRRFEIGHFDFVDDTFTVSQDRVERICDLLSAKKLHVAWAASCRVGALTLDLARRMKRAGCRLLYFGFESASQKVLDSLCKGIKVEQAWETMKVVREVGLQTMGSFIIGSPADTAQSIRETIRFARALSPSYAQFTLLTPYPGTPFYEQARAGGWIREHEWDRYSMVRPTVEHPTISARTLQRYVDWSYISFYLRPKYLWQELRSNNLYFASRAFKSLIRFLLPKQK